MKEAAKLWKAMSAEAKQPLDEKAAGLKKDEVQKQKVLEEEDAKKRACAWPGVATANPVLSQRQVGSGSSQA